MTPLPTLLPVPDMAEIIAKGASIEHDEALRWLLESIKHRELEFFSPDGDPGNIDSLAVTLAFLAPTGTPTTPEKAKLVDQVLTETCVRPRDVLTNMETARALSNICAPSDAALGAEKRRQAEDAAKRAREQTTDRHREWMRWYREGQRINESRSRPVSSYSELAKLIKKSLNLPDSEQIIRKRIAQIQKNLT